MQFLGFIVFYAVTWIIAMLPRPVFYLFSDQLALLLHYVARYRKKVIMKNLRLSFPEKSEKELQAIARKFYHFLSDLLLEPAFLMHASKRRIRKRCEFTNIEILLPAYERGKSIIVAASHYNNWEFLTLAPPLMKHKMLSIYKPIQNKWIENLMTRSRERLGSVTVLMKDTIKTIIHYEKLGVPTLIGLITDQTPTSGNHYIGTFMNQETRVFRGIETIAKKYDLPVFYCNMQRGKKRGYYKVTLELITETPREMPPDWITEQHLAALERCIRENPPYWLWSHRRWKYSRADECRLN